MEDNFEELAGQLGQETEMVALEPRAEFRDMARQLGEMFTAYQQSGFTRSESFALVMQALSAGLQGGCR